MSPLFKTEGLRERGLFLSKKRAELCRPARVRRSTTGAFPNVPAYGSSRRVPSGNAASTAAIVPASAGGAAVAVLEAVADALGGVAIDATDVTVAGRVADAPRRQPQLLMIDAIAARETTVERVPQMDIGRLLPSFFAKS